MAKEKRLRLILVRHLREINPDVHGDKITDLENDIKAFVKSIHYGASELGLKLSCEDFIGDLDD